MWHSYGSKREFCSAECLQQHTAERATCRVCKKLLYPRGIAAKNGQGCRSEACTEQYKLNAAREKGKLGTCKACKREFIKKNEYDDNLCSAECRWFVAERAGKIAACVTCGKEFIKSANNETTCSSACYTEERKRIKPVEETCPVCGTTFERHPNAKQYVCSKTCRETLNRSKREAARREKQKTAVKDGQDKPIVLAPDERGIPVPEVLSGKITGKEAQMLHLCTRRKTPQAECVLFTGKFVQHPKDVIIRIVNGKNVV